MLSYEGNSLKIVKRINGYQASQAFILNSSDLFIGRFVFSVDYPHNLLTDLVDDILTDFGDIKFIQPFSQRRAIANYGSRDFAIFEKLPNDKGYYCVKKIRHDEKPGIVQTHFTVKDFLKIDE